VKRLSLPDIVARLEAAGGPAPQPPSTDPLELVLWENAAYLVDDEQRARAFHALKSQIGFRPESILKAPKAALFKIAQLGGMVPELRVEKLRDIAEITQKDFGGNLRKALEGPLPAARKALRKYPGIGAPGADKILLFSGIAPLFSLESNGLRALVRLGFGEEKKSYSSTYSSVLKDAEPELQKDAGWLVAAHQILRRHGQELCKRSDPLCESCPLARDCAFFRKASSR
jgi:endonuclease III